MATREQWIGACGGLDVAVNTEDSILSCGREYLPATAISVLDGEEPGPEYWDFLLDQLGQMEALRSCGVVHDGSDPEAI